MKSSYEICLHFHRSIIPINYCFSFKMCNVIQIKSMTLTEKFIVTQMKYLYLTISQVLRKNAQQNYTFLCNFLIKKELKIKLSESRFIFISNLYKRSSRKLIFVCKSDFNGISRSQHFEQVFLLHFAFFLFVHL